VSAFLGERDGNPRADPLSPPVMIATLSAICRYRRCFRPRLRRGFILCSRPGCRRCAAAAEASSLWACDLRAPRVTVASQRRRFACALPFFAAAERERAERWFRHPASACLDNALP